MPMYRYSHHTRDTSMAEKEVINMTQFNTVVLAERNTAPSFSLSRVRWARVVAVVAVPVVLACMAWAHLSKPVLEDTVQWVSVAVPAGGGYDAAIQEAYAQVGTEDITLVDIRDLRYMAMKHNDNKGLLAGTVIEVPVYTGSGEYR